MNDCFYELPTKRYNAIKKYYDSRGENPCCHCPKCNYHIKRVAVKAMVPQSVYNSGTFQQTLRMEAGVTKESIALDRSDLGKFVRAFFGWDDR